MTAKCRRVGGGFGAKLSRHTPVACAAALAAKLCRRPVLMSLDRNTDMEMTGGRHDVVGTYSFGVNTTTGKIHALKVKIIFCFQGLRPLVRGCHCVGCVLVGFCSPYASAKFVTK